MSGRARNGCGAALALALSLLPGSADGQDFRAHATTSVHYVGLQPIRQDTVSRSRVEVAPDGSLVFEGHRVTCIPELPCTFYRPTDRESALAGSQDLSFTAWGLGVRGLSATGLLRGRFRLDGDFVWPRSDDALDAILAYAQLDRGGWRFRLGRQETLSGLGFAGFDGGSARWAPLRELAVEVYGGRSLARGLSEPRNDALRGLEDFIPDRNAWLMGGFARGDLGGATVAGLRYQREIWSDRSGLVQERASLDVRSGILHPVEIEGALDYDVAFDRIGKSHLTLRYPLPAHHLFFEGTLRRHVPYFELSTIWGFFSPVAYHEGEVKLAVSPFQTTSFALLGGWRRYQETHAPLIFAPLEDEGWRVEASVLTQPSGTLSAEGRYRVEWGVGAFLSSADARLRWRVREGLEVGAMGTAFQQFQEFRVGEGRVWGGGLTAGADLVRGFRLDGGVGVYRHDPEGGALVEAWNQLRAWTMLSVPFGEDAGAERPRRWRR